MRIMVLGLVAVMLQATAAAAADGGPRDGRYYRDHRGGLPDHRRHDRLGGWPTWCNQGNSMTGGVMDCSYYSLQQCLASASGVGGTCITNPAFEWAAKGYPPSQLHLYRPLRWWWY
jgi:hypothetical protein